MQIAAATCKDNGITINITMLLHDNDLIKHISGFKATNKKSVARDKRCFSYRFLLEEPL